MNFDDSLTSMSRQPPEAEDCPIWFDEKKIDEVLFCQDFLRGHPMICARGAFFTVDGRVEDEDMLIKQIHDLIKPYITSSVAKRASNLLDARFATEDVM